MATARCCPRERGEAEWRKGFLLQWLLSPVSYQCLPPTKPEFLSLLKELSSLPQETFQTFVFLIAPPPYDSRTQIYCISVYVVCSVLYTYKNKIFFTQTLPRTNFCLLGGELAPAGNGWKTGS